MNSNAVQLLNRALFNVASITYLPILVGNLVAFALCAVASRRPWCRRVCTVCLWLTALFLFLVAIELALFAARTGLRDEGGFGFGLEVMFCIPVAIEFVGLFLISRWLRPPSTLPPERTPRIR